MPVLNDVQSRLNETTVARVVTPSTPGEIRDVIVESLAGG